MMMKIAKNKNIKKKNTICLRIKYSMQVRASILGQNKMIRNVRNELEVLIVIKD